tara:strand:+ start:525 stop:902 length:378 start_codon:yes stop_codon:yes gene_type:complete
MKTLEQIAALGCTPVDEANIDSTKMIRMFDGHETRFYTSPEDQKAMEEHRAKFLVSEVPVRMGAIRKERNALLLKSDFSQGADSPMDATTKSQWATYRQALRDLPATVSDPLAFDFDSGFPKKPE